MPTSDMLNLAGWMEFGDPLFMAQIGSLVGQGASLFSKAVRDVLMEGQDRSSLMLNLIDRADAKTWVCDRKVEEEAEAVLSRLEAARIDDFLLTMKKSGCPERVGTCW